MNIAEDIYMTLTGQLQEEFQIPGVEDAFAAGQPCEQNYAAMLDAYARLCQRLGAGEEDADVEIIINALLDNEHRLCLKMFEYGAKFSQPEGR